MTDGEPTFRHPVEADYPGIVAAAAAWWGELAVRAMLPRFWVRHFGATSWLAESVDGAVLGLLVGFLSPGRPDEAVIHAVGTHPSARRRGLGSALVARFVADVRAAGRTRVVAVVWPGDPGCVRFHEAIGFVPDDIPSAARLYGVPAIADYDGPGEDRAVLVRRLEEPG